MSTKKERIVGARLPADLVADLERIEREEQSDRSTVLRRLLHRAIAEWKMDHFAQEYGRGKLTLERAAEEAGVSLWEMMDHARAKGVLSQYDLDDVAHDAAVVRSRLQG